jgi:hypothetical protein
MTKKERVIRQLVRAAKKAMKELEWAMSGTPANDVWTALYNAVKRVEGKKKLNEWMLRQRRAGNR